MQRFGEWLSSNLSLLFCTVYMLTVTFQHLSKYSNIYRARQGGRDTCLCTGTGTPPGWSRWGCDGSGTWRNMGRAPGWDTSCSSTHGLSHRCLPEATLLLWPWVSWVLQRCWGEEEDEEGTRNPPWAGTAGWGSLAALPRHKTTAEIRDSGKKGWTWRSH